MKIIHQVHPQDFVKYNAQEIRDRFLLENLVKADRIECVYTHYDRMIVGAATPLLQLLELDTYDQLKSENFLDRREIGIVNIAGKGSVTVDGEKIAMDTIDCLYIGKGKKKILFSSEFENNPAKFIFFSCPAHKEYPTRLMKPEEAMPAAVGTL
jgi:4-deoxy-L-threo-5-hexosulose-uronate ketol-isomerase